MSSSDVEETSESNYILKHFLDFCQDVPKIIKQKRHRCLVKS